MNARRERKLLLGTLACAATVAMLGLSGCASDGYSNGGVSTSVGVSYGYGGYYGPDWYGGYYQPYPPVVIVPPDNRPDRPNKPDGGGRPSTLPADVGGPSTRPATPPPRPAASTRPTSRPSPRPAPRPMPRGGGGIRR
jgi:hypothetical protein